jgi:hypothetical protein
MRLVSRPPLLVRQCSAAFECCKSLPVVRKENHLARSFRFREELTHRLPLMRQKQVRSDISERSKHKGSQVESRMRQLQSLFVDSLVAAVEQIDINGSRNVVWMIPFAAQRFFDLNQLLKQARRINAILKFNGRIQKFSGSRFATNGFSLVNRRGKNRWLYICEIENCLSRCPQIPKSIANIRAESDCGSHSLCSGGP